MNIPKAIEILITFHDQAACTLDATSANAFKLGIEAMKLIQRLRAKEYFGYPTELEGETED